MVLLNDAWMCMMPLLTTFFSFFLKVFFFPVFAGAFAMDSSLGLGGCFLLIGDGPAARSLTGSRVGMGPLTAHRQTAAMTKTAISAHFDEALDIHRDFLAEVAFDSAFILNQGT